MSKIQCVISAADVNSAIRIAFHPINLISSILFFVYMVLIALAQPVYYSKLSDRFRDIVVLDKTHPPKDLVVWGPGAVKIALFNQTELPFLELRGTDSEESILFLFPGDGILPQEPEFAYMAIMSFTKGGSLSPSFINSDRTNQLYFDYSGTHHVRHFSEVDSQAPLTTGLVTCKNKNNFAFAILGKNVFILDLFFFRISNVRSWGRTPMPRGIDPITGKFRPL